MIFKNKYANLIINVDSMELMWNNYFLKIIKQSITSVTVQFLSLVVNY